MSTTNVHQEQLSSALRALKFDAPDKRQIGRLPIMGHALLTSADNITLAIVAIDQDWKRHVVTVDMVTTAPFAFTVPFKTLKESAASFEPLDGYLKLEWDEAAQTLIIRQGRDTVRIKGIAASEFPPVDNITRDNPDLIWHDYKWKLAKPKQESKRKPKQQYDGNTGTSVLDWVERDQARRKAAQLERDSIDMPALILNTFDRSAEHFGKPSAIVTQDDALIVRLHEDGEMLRFKWNGNVTAIDCRYGKQNDWKPDTWYRPYLAQLTRAQIIELAQQWQRDNMPAPELATV